MGGGFVIVVTVSGTGFFEAASDFLGDSTWLLLEPGFERLDRWAQDPATLGFWWGFDALAEP